MDKLHITTIRLMELRKTTPTEEEKKHLQDCNGCNNYLEAIKNPLATPKVTVVEGTLSIGEIYSVTPSSKIVGHRGMPYTLIISGNVTEDSILNIKTVPVMVLHDNVDTPVADEFYTGFEDGSWSRSVINKNEFSVPENFLTTSVGKVGMKTALQLKSKEIDDSQKVGADSIGGEYGKMLQRRYEIERTPFEEDLKRRRETKKEVITTLSKVIDGITLEDINISIIDTISKNIFSLNNLATDEESDVKLPEVFAKQAGSGDITNFENIVEERENLPQYKDNPILQGLRVLVETYKYIETGYKDSYNSVLEHLDKFRKNFIK